MSARLPRWLTLPMDAFQFGLEAQSVIGLRLLKAALGSAGAHDEARLMITEKTQAALDAQLVMATSAISGEGHLGPARALAIYRRRVRANHRRLTRDG
jgi:hypothetical protein